MSPIHLSQAIVHWLEYQSICGRSELFCEAYLANPIGEYCLSVPHEHFEPEYPYPPAYQAGAGRRRSLDFALFKQSLTGTQKVMTDAIETKFVTAKRNFTQEIYDDLFRLLWFQPTRDPDRCRRWLVIAGFCRNLFSEHFLHDMVQVRRGRNQPQTCAFRGLLSADLNNHTRTKPIQGAAPAIHNLWTEAARNFGQHQHPDAITVRLAGRTPATARPGDACCYVWEIIRPQPDFTATHPF